MCQMLYIHSHRLPNLTLQEWYNRAGWSPVATRVMPCTTLDGTIFIDYGVSGTPCSCAMQRVYLHSPFYR